jgi:hypothetical protein
MAFAVFKPLSDANDREFESLGQALHFAASHNLLIFDTTNGVAFTRNLDARWDLRIGGQVSGRSWNVDPWTTEELVMWYPTMKAGEVDGYTFSCVLCDAGPEHYWPLMRSLEGDLCLCQCDDCGWWSALEPGPVIVEPYVRSRPSDLA